MANNYLPANDAKYAAWLANFQAVVSPDAAALGLPITAGPALASRLEGLQTAMAADTAARAAAKSATADKHAARKGGDALVRGFARTIQANPNVSDATRQSLGLPVRKQPVKPVAPVPPAALVATPKASGVNTLQWKPGGNAPGAVYVVEAATPVSGAWTQIGASTKTRFDHEGVTPGQPLMYRVWAQRGDMQSAASNHAIVYGG